MAFRVLKAVAIVMALVGGLNMLVGNTATGMAFLAFSMGASAHMRLEEK